MARERASASPPPEAPSRGGPPELGISLDVVLRAAVAAVVLVTLANLVGIAMAPWEGDGFASGTAEWLLLANENNPPTWLASMLFLLAAGAAALCAAAAPSEDRRWWWATGLLLTLFSLDEVASMHEKLDDYLNIDTDALPDFLGYGWVIPGVVILAGIATLFFRFVRRQPHATRAGILVGMGVIVLGAVGVEIVAAWWDSKNGRDNAGYYLISTVEETLEMVGSLILLATLGAHAARGATRFFVQPFARRS